MSRVSSPRAEADALSQGDRLAEATKDADSEDDYSNASFQELDEKRQMLERMVACLDIKIKDNERFISELEVTRDAEFEQSAKAESECEGMEKDIEDISASFKQLRADEEATGSGVIMALRRNEILTTQSKSLNFKKMRLLSQERRIFKEYSLVGQHDVALDLYQSNETRHEDLTNELARLCWEENSLKAALASENEDCENTADTKIQLTTEPMSSSTLPLSPPLDGRRQNTDIPNIPRPPVREPMGFRRPSTPSYVQSKTTIVSYLPKIQEEDQEESEMSAASTNTKDNQDQQMPESKDTKCDPSLNERTLHFPAVPKVKPAIDILILEPPKPRVLTPDQTKMNGERSLTPVVDQKTTDDIGSSSPPPPVGEKKAEYESQMPYFTDVNNAHGNQVKLIQSKPSLSLSAASCHPSTDILKLEIKQQLVPAPPPSRRPLTPNRTPKLANDNVTQLKHGGIKVEHVRVISPCKPDKKMSPDAGENNSQTGNVNSTTTQIPQSKASVRTPTELSLNLGTLEERTPSPQILTPRISGKNPPKDIINFDDIEERELTPPLGRPPSLCRPLVPCAAQREVFNVRRKVPAPPPPSSSKPRRNHGYATETTPFNRFSATDAGRKKNLLDVNGIKGSASALVQRPGTPIINTNGHRKPMPANVWTIKPAQEAVEQRLLNKDRPASKTKGRTLKKLETTHKGHMIIDAAASNKITAKPPAGRKVSQPKGDNSNIMAATNAQEKPFLPVPPAEPRPKRDVLALYKKTKRRLHSLD